MGKVILFVRVSTEQQHLESQEDALKRAAATDGYKEDDFIIIGKKESAIKLDEDNRQGLHELKKQLSEGDIDCIYIFELSRLSRKPMVLYSIRDQLLDARVQLKCLNPAFTLLNSERTGFDNTASLIFSLFGAMAEQEMIEKKERFRRGKRRLAEEGRYNGGNIPFGYKIDKEHKNKIIVNDEEAKLVKEIFNLYESGISQPQLAKEYYRRGERKLTISFINNILNNERYTGCKRCYRGSSYERAYPILITPEQFQHCREIARNNNTTADKTKNIYYANKLIVCKDCGCYWSASGSKVSYHCYDAFNVMRKYDHYKTPQCKNRKSISINIMDSLLWYVAKDAELDYIMNAASEDKQKYEERINILEQKISFVKVRLEDLDKKRDRIVESYIDGDLTKEKRDDKFRILDEKRKEILLEQTSFQNEKEHLKFLLEDIRLEYDIDDVSKITGHLERTMSLEEKIASISDDEERSRIIHRHIQEITIENREIEYEFGIGKRKTPTRFITIKFYNGEKQYYHYLPSTGRGGVVLLSTSDGLPMEKIRLEYLDRFCDEGKRRRYQEAKEKRQKERKAKYPDNEYILGYSSLARFLKVGVSTAYRWIETLNVLKPAVVDTYNKEIVVDKKKCIELLAVAAECNVWARKIFNNINNRCYEGKDD